MSRASAPVEAGCTSAHPTANPATPIASAGPITGWLKGRRWTCIGIGAWPVRPRVTPSVITPRSPAKLKRPTLGVVLGLPFVAADDTEQISHESPSSTSVWMALTLHRSWPSASPSVLACLASPLPRLWANQNRRRTLSAANSTLAAASTRIAVAATWSKTAGVEIVAAFGQLIATKGGLPVGSINSTLRWSSRSGCRPLGRYVCASGGLLVG